MKTLLLGLVALLTFLLPGIILLHYVNAQTGEEVASILFIIPFLFYFLLYLSILILYELGTAIEDSFFKVKSRKRKK